MCKLSRSRALFKHWLWRLTSQNYSHGPTSLHEHQQEWVYSSAVAEYRFAVSNSSPLTWVWLALPVLVEWGLAKWAEAQEGLWLAELQEPEPVSGHCPAKARWIKDCASPLHHYSCAPGVCYSQHRPTAKLTRVSCIKSGCLTFAQGMKPPLFSGPFVGDRTSQVSLADPCACAPSLCLGWLLEGITVNCFIFLFHCLRWGKMAKYLGNSIARDDPRVQGEKRQQQQAAGKEELGSPVPHPEHGQSMRLAKRSVLHCLSLVWRAQCRVEDFFTMKQLGSTWR